MAVADKVKSIIVEQLGVDEEEVTPDASFVDDLGADSLDTVELVMAFEEEFGIEIPDEDAEKITRVKEAVEYIEAHAQEQEVGFSVDQQTTGRRHRHRPGVVARDRHRGELGGALRRPERRRARSRSSTRRSLRRASRARSRASTRCSSSRRKTSRRWTSSFSTRSRRRSSRWTMRSWRSRPNWGRASASSSRRASAGSPPSSASTRRCSRAARARSRPSSFPRPSSTSRPARCRSGSAPRGRTRRPARPARRRRTRSAMRSRSSSAATPTSMIAGGSEAAITPMGVGGFGALRALSHAQRRAGAREPSLRQGPRRLHHRRRRRRPHPRGARDGAEPRRADLRRARRLRHVGRRVSHHRAVGRRRRRRSASWARRSKSAGIEPSQMSTTSTRTAPRRRTATRSRRSPSRRCFGEHAKKLAISSTKSMTGHLLGAAGGLEAGITALAVRDQVVAADDQPRPAGRGVRPRLRAEHQARRCAIEYALSNSFGFGGTNAALLFKRYEA